jgi:hypothetical protein
VGGYAFVPYNLAKNALSVTNRQYLTLRPNTITDPIQLRVYVQDLVTSKRGYAEIIVVPNLAPIGGRCYFQKADDVEVPVALLTVINLVKVGTMRTTRKAFYTIHLRFHRYPEKRNTSRGRLYQLHSALSSRWVWN